jgi:periplasmic protein TonB
MAYIDQRTEANRRAAIAGVVALIQGAVVVALIHGLAVTFTKPEPVPNPQSEQIRLPPPPEKVEPEQLPSPRPADQRTVAETPPRQLDLPVRTAEATPVPSDRVPPLPPAEPVEVGPKPSPTLSPIAAKPRNAPGSWVTSSDYPSRDLREGNQGVVGFTLTIGPDGKVESCAITRSSGFPGLDAATCDKVTRRARFDAASDGSGNRVTGTYSGRIRWQIPRD